jgi:hypothetical protein
MGRRIDIEPDDIHELLGKGRVPGELEAPPAVRGEAVRPPDLLHRRDREPGGLRHGAGGPVRCLVRRRRQGQPDDLRGSVHGNGRLAGRPGPVPEQPVHAFGHEPLLPAPDAGLRDARLAHDRGRAVTVIGEKDDPGTPHMLLGALAIANDGLEPPAIGGRDRDGHSTAHGADSHDVNAKGIPNRTLPYRSIH